MNICIDSSEKTGKWNNLKKCLNKINFNVNKSTNYIAHGEPLKPNFRRKLDT